MHLSIKGRVGLSSGLLAAMLVGIGSLGLFGMSQSNDALLVTFANQMPAVRDIGTAALYSAWERLGVDHSLLLIGTPELDGAISNARALRAKSDAAWQHYMTIPKSPTSRALAAETQEKRLALQAAMDKSYAAMQAGDRETATEVNKDMAVSFTAQVKADDKLMDFLNQRADDGYNAAVSTFDTIRWLSILAIVAGVAVAFYAWYSLRRAIGLPLNAALQHFAAISSGDLRTHVDVRSRDEMGELMTGIAAMQKSLIQTVAAVRAGSESIATATQQIAAGNTDLSSRTEEQASALQQTAASMEQLTGTVKQNADNARQASSLAANASSIANKGSVVVSEVVGTMGEINQSSTKIADIISIIEGIAFQTNILALNAAVEAARAGEEGRGFAVVAGEVRNLAQRSSAAAKEIKELIDASVDRVTSGAKLVDEAGSTMNEIIAAVRHVTDIMGEIAAASSEQSSGIDQVALAVSQMDEATQQNAALVEEAAAAAQSLEDQTRGLREAVSIFKLHDRATPMLAV